MNASLGKGRKSLAILLPGLFACCLLLPTMDWCFHLDHAPLFNENRQMGKFPQYKGLTQIKDFLLGVESCFNDNFGFRNRLVRTSSRWKRELFKEACTDQVVIGTDNWLFFAGAEMIEHYTGAISFTEQDLKNWQSVLETRRDWIRKRGGQYLIVIPPDKHSVYPEYLPQWLVKGQQPSKLDQLLEYMRVHSTVTILDLRPCLIEAKKAMPIFLNTYTHWNQYGAFAGYQAVMNTLSNSFPDLAPLPLSAFTCTFSSNTTGGDLVRLLGDNRIHERFAIDLTPPPSLPVLALTNCLSRLPKQWRKDTDPLITFNPNAARKLVLFRDSFSCCWYPILGQHFREVLYIWQYEWDRAFLEREKPDMVIDEILERYFNREDPKKWLKKDNLGSESLSLTLSTS